MSEIKVNSIKGVGATDAAITVNNTDGTCTANITNNLSNRNLIINGAMQVAQRGTSSTGTLYQTVDRMAIVIGGTDENPTQEQVDVASGTTPYSLGFRKAFKITNGNQTGGLGAADIVEALRYRVEAQDMANSGWNYTDSNSFITLSFWVKSSVSFNMKGYFFTQDNSYNYPLETGTLTADTWTKITRTIPGNSNVVFNNDNDHGLTISWGVYGTNYSSGNPTVNQWVAYSAATLTNPSETTWYTTNDATLEFTGLQLEVGSVATDFEHRSFGDELARCQRYFTKTYNQDVYAGTPTYDGAFVHRGPGTTGTTVRLPLPFPVLMRATPSLSFYGTTAATNSIGKIRGSGNVQVTVAVEPATSPRIIELGFTPNQNYSYFSGHYTASAEF